MLRSRAVLRFLVLTVAVAVAGCDSPKLAAPPEPGALMAPGGVSPRRSYGIDPGNQYGIDFGGDSLYDYTTKLRAAQLMSAAGIKFARVTAYWYYLQQFIDNTFTPWELTKLHETIQALEAAGITPYITLEASACFAVSETFPCVDVYNPPDNEAHWQAWTTYVQQMVQEFPDVHYWGIWNEPNASGFLYPNGGDRLAAYKQLVERAAPAIHAAGGIVIGPDLGDGTDPYNGLDPASWLTNFLSTHGSYVDVVAVHLYGQVTINNYQTTMGTYSNILGGGPWDLWLTETARGGGNATDLEQAVNLSNAYRAMNSGVVPRWGKTFYMNAGTFAPNNNWGIVHDLGTTVQQPRPAYDTLAAISSQPVPPPTFGTVTITGPTRVNGCEYGTWTATPSGGVAPYTYEWTVDGDVYGSGSSASFSYLNDGSSLSFFIQVTATDGQGRTAKSSNWKTNVRLPGSC